MSIIDDFQSDWQQQAPKHTPSEEGGAQVRAEVSRLRAGYRLTIFILVLTLGVVGVFFYIVGAMNTPGYGLPVALMLGALFFRILAEIVSRYRSRQISPGMGVAEYNRTLSRHYRSRLWIHFLLTPLALVAYTWGFVLLLPTFKAQLSAGFYTYILVSGGVVLLGIVWLIAFSIRKELGLLASLSAER